MFEISDRHNIFKIFLEKNLQNVEMFQCHLANVIYFQQNWN